MGSRQGHCRRKRRRPLPQLDTDRTLCCCSSRADSAASLSLPRAQITSTAQLTAEFTLLLTALAKEETEHTWEQIDKALRRFQAVIRGGACKFTDEFVRQMRAKEVVVGIVRSVRPLPSPSRRTPADPPFSRPTDGDGAYTPVCHYAPPPLLPHSTGTLVCPPPPALPPSPPPPPLSHQQALPLSNRFHPLLHRRAHSSARDPQICRRRVEGRGREEREL